MTAKRLLRQDLTRYGLALFGISGLINILALTGAIYMMQVYDRALTSGSLNTLLALSILALGL
ncbi:type I secretion system permease/ATPase, partial [Cereibacter changlensis JA139]